MKELLYIYLLIINAIAFALMLIDKYKEKKRIRLRSRGPAINELAQKYNGGGHKLASGGTLKSWNDLEEFVKLTDELVKSYKNN